LSTPSAIREGVQFVVALEGQDGDVHASTVGLQALRLALGSTNLTDLPNALADVRTAVDEEIFR
jgi:hypothetical protein